MLGIMANSRKRGYAAQAVTFDGTNDYMQRIISEPGSFKTYTMSFWIRPASVTTTQLLFGVSTTYSTLTGGGIFAQQATDGKMLFTARNSLGNAILSWKTDSGLTINTWHHIMISVDLASEANSYIYVNGTVQTGSAAVFTNTTIQFETYSQFGTWASGSQILNADVADFWWNNTWIDLSSSTNREKFIKDGKPVDLGSDGSNPTGSQPYVCFIGDATSWDDGTNSGSAGDYTVTGTITNSTNEPVKVP